jgi:periplasmic copper chaperone A
VNHRTLIDTGSPVVPSAAVRRGGALTACAALAATALCVSACASTAAPQSADAGSAGVAAAASASSSLGHASSGDIEVTGAYIPQPASPDVAVAYFTLTDTGARGDVLLSATTDPASQAAVMRESSSGANAGTMLEVTGGLAVPAHGAVTLAPGSYHLMLTDPAIRLVAGGHVTLTLVLRDAGRVRVNVPVTSLTSDAQSAPMPSMSGM